LPAAEAQLWKRFVPADSVPADPDADYSLTEKNGPWLIMAATFSGDGAEEQSRQLAVELRQRFNLASYVHKMAFDFSDDSPGRGVDAYGAPIKRRYRRDGDLQFAVLVGDFPQIDDPDGQQVLERVKQLQPEALRIEDGGRTAQTLVQVRAFQDAVLSKLGAERKRGPMGQAFMARNPLLPREYFVPKGVDDFVAKMNEGVKYSLLDCPGKYTVQVATFRGKTILQTGKSEATSQTAKKKRAAEADDALVEAAENAHLLTEELRAHGWEAYEFHNRTESIVTIGSFDEVLRQLSDGRQIATPAVQRIVEKFGAAYDTPADPLNDIGNDLGSKRRLDQTEQEVSQRLAQQQLKSAPGLHPKHVNILRKRAGKLRTERLIPIDIHPQAIEVPRRSISSAYVRSR
jgi:hypothetical protein